LQKNKKGSVKAVMTTSMKLLGIIFQTLKEEWVFEDFPDHVLIKAE